MLFDTSQTSCRGKKYLLWAKGLWTLGGLAGGTVLGYRAEVEPILRDGGTA